MPRPKGSKNKKTAAAAVSTDMVLAQKVALKDKLAEQVKELEAAVKDAKASLKNKKSQLKAVEKEVAKLQQQKEMAEKAEAQKADKAALEQLVKDMMNSGVSAKDIIEKLQG